jgi:hypothetical protein
MRTSFNMADENITMVRGDTLAFGFFIEGLEGQLLDTAYFSCKANKSDTGYVFRKSIGSGISRTGDGKYQVRVAPADTKDIEAGRYFYDLQIGINSDVFTIMHGVLEITQDVTY